MAKKKSKAESTIHYHKDGSIWAKGMMAEGKHMVEDAGRILCR